MLAELADTLSFLLSTGNEDPLRIEKEIQIEKISVQVSELLRTQELPGITGTNLKTLAYAVNDRIRDPYLRNQHILSAV